MPVLCIYPVTGPAGRQIQTVLLFPGAALAEITGCFAVWDRWGLGKSDWWLLPGAFALALFAFLPARADCPDAGRTFAAYTRIYVVNSPL
ncbi:hypothetical protein V6L76_18370 [Pannonibacter sp. Pt2]|uniref:Uncharacterized protein n=1 Tax=Pannonibacter anstelovis TaxID=3121537 RepID=A0ABU7ZSP3_9HYPH